MRIDGLPLVVTSLICVALAAVALARLWDRGHQFIRVALAALSLLTVLLTAAVVVNRLTETYASWSALISGQAVDDGTDVPPAAAVAPVPAASAAPDPAAPASRIVAVKVTGRASGMTARMFVYLPAAYDSEPGTRFPVIEALHGFPGSPHTWIFRLRVQSVLDAEIAAGRMAPTIVVLPYQTTSPLLDTECLNLTRGPKAETFLTTDVPAYVDGNFRARTDGRAWGLVGYSAGGYCALNLAVKHPREYAAGASLSGYGTPGIVVGDHSEHSTNDVDWRLTHLPPPAVALYLAWANDDHPTRRQALGLLGQAKPPLSVTSAVLAQGGHSMAAWQEMEAPAFDWLSAQLARPLR